MKRNLKIAVIAGEESGDLLASDLLLTCQQLHNGKIDLIGVGGRHLQALGLKSLFAMEDISLVGLASILKNIPKLIHHIHHTANSIVAAKPDGLIIIDAPDFTHRVGAKVRAKLPHLPIIQYVAPTVWAWRPQRAEHMRKFIDHLLVLLPFEVAALRELGGPEATYVGHPLLFNPTIAAARRAQQARHSQITDEKLLLILPGSRLTEIRNLLPIFGQTCVLLQKNFANLRLVLPTLTHLYDEVVNLTKDWQVAPDIIIDEEKKAVAFAQADAALAASGTVSLELALSMIPMVLCYKADWFARQFILPKVTIWSAALPNIIADSPIVPEYYNEFVRPATLARQLRRHMIEGAARHAQIEGFTQLIETMQTPLPEKTRGAQLVLEQLSRKVGAGFRD